MTDTVRIIYNSYGPCRIHRMPIVHWQEGIAALIVGFVLGWTITNARADTTYPLCEFAVATDAPNVSAVIEHENAHCWGFKHKAHDKHSVMNSRYQATKPSAYWISKGAYPNLIVYYDTGRVIAAKYCDGNAYGCQWGGLQ